MSETPKVPALAENDPRRWIAAIVGGVVLGEALWSLLQLLIRDWAMPALMNALGQGPTQNQNAFLPQPLFVAFIESCLAGILLVLLMAWSGRGRRRVRVIVEPRAVSSVPVAPAPASRPAAASYAPAVPAPVPQAAGVSAPAATPVVVATVPTPAPTMEPAPVVSAARVELPVEPTRAPIPNTAVETAEWKVAAESASAPVAPPVPAASQAAPPKPGPAAVPTKAKSKKPKTVYYNIVGEPIESDE